MNRFFLSLCVGCIFCSCVPSALMTVSVSENAGLERKSETIELNMDQLAGMSAKVMPGQIVVRNGNGQIVPFQTYKEFDGRNMLVFQVDVASGGHARYYICSGTISSPADTVAYSRHVPERRDDYAYENDIVAGRIYGPALKNPRTLGSDIWTKSTARLVIDERFARGKYHRNFGDGMDCYKVGKTLGGGALAPLSDDGGIVLGDNWKECTHITDGPVRTKARFVHGPFNVNGSEVSVTREMTLDAGSHFVLWTSEFSCNDGRDSMDVALSATMHSPYKLDSGPGWVAFVEPASDSKQPEIDGDIFVAVVLDPTAGPGEIRTVQNHSSICTRIVLGSAVRSWTGSGWSQAGNIVDEQQWRDMTEALALRAASPLIVKISKK